MAQLQLVPIHIHKVLYVEQTSIAAMSSTVVTETKAGGGEHQKEAQCDVQCLEESVSTVTGTSSPDPKGSGLASMGSVLRRSQSLKAKQKLEREQDKFEETTGSPTKPKKAQYKTVKPKYTSRNSK